MTKRHAKHKKNSNTSNNKEAGFLSFDIKRLMSKRDKFLTIGIVLGVVALVLGAIYIIVGNRSDMGEDREEEAVVIDPSRKETVPYPTLPTEIQEATVLVNSRAILPNSITIKVGGNVGFFNEEEVPVSIQGYDQGSEVLNIGPIEPFDIPVVVFDSVGTYRYINPSNPDDVAQIIVEQ